MMGTKVEVTVLHIPYKTVTYHIWWRWRVSNPRPPILCLKIYMLRLLYLINPSRPESQGAMGEPF